MVKIFSIPSYVSSRGYAKNGTPIDDINFGISAKNSAKVLNDQAKKVVNAVNVANANSSNDTQDIEKIANQVMDSYYENNHKSVIGSKIRRKLIGLFEYFGKNNGEVQTQLANNFFTIFWSWVFIAYNPLSDKDPRDKKYAAWRQPVSGAVALGVTLPSTLMFNNFLDRIFMKGYVDKNDQRYLYPNQQNEKKWGHKLSKLKVAVANKKVKSEDVTIQDFLVSLNSAERKNITLVEKNGRKFVKIIGDGVAVEDREEFVPRIVDEKSLDEYLNKYNIHQIKFKDILAKEFDIEFNKAGEIRTEAFKKQIKNIRAIDFITKLGIMKKDEISAAELIKFLNNVRLERVALGEYTIDAVKELRMLIDIIKISEEDRPGLGKIKNSLDKMIKDMEDGNIDNRLLEIKRKEMVSISKQCARMIQRYKGKSYEESNVTLAQFLHDFGYMKEDNEPIMKEVNALANKSFKEVISIFLEAFRNKDLSNFAEKLPKIGQEQKFVDRYLANNLMNGFMEKTGTITKATRFYAGIIQSLPVAVLACFILNEIYPRVIKKVNPSLLENDEPQKMKRGIK